MEEEIRKEFMEMIKLLEEGKLQEFKQKATECPPVDIAEGLEEIEDEGRVLRVFRMLPKDISSDVFSYMTSEQQQLIAESATNAELKALVDDMFMDDTVDFLEEMPANVVKKVLQNADEGTRKTINQFLNYPENSAGSLMTIEYVDLHDYFTVRKAMDYIRRTGIDKETVYTCYVIDDQRRLVGQVSPAQADYRAGKRLHPRYHGYQYRQRRHHGRSGSRRRRFPPLRPDLHRRLR